MKRFTEQFNKKASGIKLRANERRELRDRIVSYMEYHPLPAELRQAVDTKAKKVSEFAPTSEPFTTFSFDFGMIRNVVGLFAIILVIGVPVIAERSMPGDVLYPVKVQFNEEVRGTLALSPYAQVEWETERLERRLTEARLLASEGKLTDEVEAGVALAIKSHSDSAKASIAKIRETDADDAALAEITFASALSAQNEAFESQVAKEDKTNDGSDGRSVASLATVVAEETRVAQATQANAKPSYEKLLARVEQETTEAYELFASIEEVALPEEVTDIERRLNDIKRKVAEALSLHASGPAELVIEPALPQAPDSQTAATDTPTTSEAVTDEVATDTEPVTEIVIEAVEPETEGAEDTEQAIALLRAALTDTQKLISFMTNIDVRENVNIDELVPVSLTNDEKILLIKNTLKEVATLRTEMDKRSVPEVVAEKFAIGEARLESLVAEATSALNTDELIVAKARADEALHVASDLFAMSSATPQLEAAASTTEPADEERSTESVDSDASSTEETEA